MKFTYAKIYQFKDQYLFYNKESDLLKIKIGCADDESLLCFLSKSQMEIEKDWKMWGVACVNYKYSHNNTQKYAEQTYTTRIEKLKNIKPNLYQILSNWKQNLIEIPINPHPKTPILWKLSNKSKIYRDIKNDYRISTEYTKNDNIGKNRK